nr:hypothetical protein [Tanacetum cinerariifolium]
KFLGTVHFGKDHITAILGYGDLKWGNIIITRVYFIEGLGHNLFSVGQFCDADLEVTFRRNTCFIRELDGVDLLKDDYSRYTWVHFHKTKDETPEVIKNFLKKIFVRLQSPVIIIRIDNRTEFKNHVLKEYFNSVGITHETFAVKTPQQNGVVERRNRTLVEAARSEKPDISYLHVFEALCYSKNDREDIGKLGAKDDIGFFIGYSANSVAYRVYNQRTKKIMEMMNVTFDELSTMAFEQNISRPGLQSMTSRQIIFELELTYAPSTITPQRPNSEPVPTNSSNTPVSSHNVDAPSQQLAQQQRNLTPSPTASAADNVPNAMFEGDSFVNPFATPSTESVVSSTQYVDPSNMHTFCQPYPHDYQWTKDHPL